MTTKILQGDSDFNKLDIGEIGSQCRVTEPQEGIKTEIGKNLIARTAGNQEEFNPNDIIGYFSILGNGGRLTVDQGASALKFITAPYQQEYLKLFVATNKDMFARIIHDARLDTNNLNLTVTDFDHLLFEAGSYVGTKKLEQYIIGHTDGIIETNTPSEIIDSTPESVKEFRKNWFERENPPYFDGKDILDELIAKGFIRFENYRGFDNVCHIDIPGFSGRFYAPKIIPSEKTKEAYTNIPWRDGENYLKLNYVPHKTDDGIMEREKSLIASDVKQYFDAGLQMASLETLELFGEALKNYDKPFLRTSGSHADAWAYFTGYDKEYRLSRQPRPMYGDPICALQPGRENSFPDMFDVGEGAYMLFTD